MEEKYGQWTVLGPSSDKKYYSRCQCSCGIIKDVNNSTLRLGKSTSCGHDMTKNLRERSYDKTDEAVVGKRFGRLAPIKRINDVGASKYLCKCDCGNETIVAAAPLLNSTTVSCGCFRKETATQLMDKIMEMGHKKQKKDQVEGTAIYSLTQKTSKNNTTGVKGVSKTKNGKYRAYIYLRRRQKYLGTFNTIEEASSARKKAEKVLFNPILERHKED